MWRVTTTGHCLFHVLGADIFKPLSPDRESDASDVSLTPRSVESEQDTDVKPTSQRPKSPLSAVSEFRSSFTVQNSYVTH